jgi:hypothetical protein
MFMSDSECIQDPCVAHQPLADKLSSFSVYLAVLHMEEARGQWHVSLWGFQPISGTLLLAVINEAPRELLGIVFFLSSSSRCHLMCRLWPLRGFTSCQTRHPTVPVRLAKPHWQSKTACVWSSELGAVPIIGSFDKAARSDC